MKRMSEVFKLPPSYVDVAEFTVNLTKDEVKAVQLSVNHVDALADALSALIKLVDDKEDVDMFRNSAYKESVQALAAYRGGK